MAFIACKNCKKEINIDADSCPYCRTKQSYSMNEALSQIGKNFFLGCLGIVFLSLLLSQIPLPDIEQIGGIIESLFFLLAFAGFYFLPALKANERRKKDRAAIFVLNFFLGWTLIGWVVALTWAFTADKTDTNQISQKRDVISRLRELDAMLKSGILTQHEFEALKSKTIGGQ